MPLLGTLLVPAFSSMVGLCLFIGCYPWLVMVLSGAFLEIGFINVFSSGFASNTIMHLGQVNKNQSKEIRVRKSEKNS
jgi:formate hydrogenlyase subunit 3/multisubunit Na+/H+ antiporter MnhD subunit